MSGLIDKAKNALKGNDKAEQFADKQINQRMFAENSHTVRHSLIMFTEVDNATDKAGLGDKYDKKISDGINNQAHEQVFKK